MGTNVSKILKSKRKELKLSVKDVIAKLEKRGVTVSDKTLYSWESGHRQPDSEGRGFESLRAGHKKPHEIAVFRLFRRFFLLLLFIDFYRILSLFILFYGSMYGSNPSQN